MSSPSRTSPRPRNWCARGQFNAANVLRPLAHAQRSDTMTPARHGEVDLPELLRRNHSTLRPAARVAQHEELDVPGRGRAANQ